LPAPAPPLQCWQLFHVPFRVGVDKTFLID
jgi:hypothetical protein